MIGYWHHNVDCLSVCLYPSITLCIEALWVGVDGYIKLYRCVPPSN